MFRIATSVFSLSIFLPVADALAHSGDTNTAGCHMNHRTGGYHCHTPKMPSYGQTTYCFVIQGQRRCGFALGTC